MPNALRRLARFVARAVALVFYPPASVATRYCRCAARPGEVWGVRGHVVVATCKACGERVPMLRARGGAA